MQRLDSLTREVTCANLKAGGKVPDDNDRLRILVIGERRKLMQDFGRWVGVGSNSYDLTRAHRMSLSTSLSETGENCDKLRRIEVAVSEATDFGKAEKGKRSE